MAAATYSSLASLLPCLFPPQAAFRGLTAALRSELCRPLHDAVASRLSTPLAVAGCAQVLRRFEWAPDVQARCCSGRRSLNEFLTVLPGK